MADPTQVVARRGDAENAPENTLPAFESAIALGADAVELDVHPTVDGQLIVHHPYNLGHTDNGQGLVHEKSLEELKALDSGSWFSEQFSDVTKPTLSEVLALCRGKIRLEIDLKGSNLDFLHQVIREVERFDLADDVEFTTAHSPLLACLKRDRPQLKAGTFFYEPPAWMPVRLAQQHAFDWSTLLKIDVVHLHLSLITPGFVEKLHRHGLIVYGSNLDTQADIRQGITLGIDSLSTGRLKMALQLRNSLSKTAL